MGYLLPSKRLWEPSLNDSSCDGYHVLFIHNVKASDLCTAWLNPTGLISQIQNELAALFPLTVIGLNWI